MKKREKEKSRRRDEEEDPSRLVWMKYSLGLKHQVVDGSSYHTLVLVFIKSNNISSVTMHYGTSRVSHVGWSKNDDLRPFSC